MYKIIGFIFGIKVNKYINIKSRGNFWKFLLFYKEIKLIFKVGKDSFIGLIYFKIFNGF